MTAIGTTTAMAMVPLFDSPVLAVDAAEVTVGVVMAEVLDGIVGVVVLSTGVVVSGGINVLKEVAVTVTTSPPGVVSGTTGTIGVGVGLTMGVGVGVGVVGSTGIVGTIGVVVGVEMDGVLLDSEAVVTLVRVCIVTARTHC